MDCFNNYYPTYPSRYRYCGVFFDYRRNSNGSHQNPIYSGIGCHQYHYYRVVFLTPYENLSQRPTETRYHIGSRLFCFYG